MATITSLRTAAALEKKAHRLFKVVDTVVDKARSAIQQKTFRLSSSPNQPPSITSTYFDILPAELQVGIFRYCSYNDLLNLRLTSHAFKNIIDVNESVIAREMLPLQDYAELSRHFPPPRVPQLDKPQYCLRYIHFLLTRHITCHELAWFLAENAVNPIIEKFQKREKRLAIQSIQAFLTPQLYLAYAFIHYTYIRLDAARATMMIE
ncbi:hypothetical protein DFH27DRAFT_618772 [Peziza echinospora]|nr:hypothetical protein DFH27DRAFT_618772 [Peziza echinospora]